MEISSEARRVTHDRMSTAAAARYTIYSCRLRAETPPANHSSCTLSLLFSSLPFHRLQRGFGSRDFLLAVFLIIHIGFLVVVNLRTSFRRSAQ